MACAISKDKAFNCAAPAMGGIVSRVILGNYSDWKNATVVVDGTSKEITSITLAAGGVEFFEWDVAKSSNIIATSPLRAVDGIDGYDHTLSISANGLVQLDFMEIENMKWTKVVAIVELLDGRSLIYGGYPDATPEPQGIGLRISETDFNPGDAGTGGNVNFTLKTPDVDPPELYLPYLIASSFDIDGLLTPTA